MKFAAIPLFIFISFFGFSQNISSNSPVCSKGSDTLKLFAEGGSSYVWTGPNGFTSRDQNPKIINPTASARGSYEVKIDGKEPSSVLVDVGEVPVNYAYLNFHISGTTILFSPNYYEEGTKYYWTGPDSFESDLASPRILKFGTENFGMYRLVITDKYGCETPLMANVTAANEGCPYKPEGYVRLGDRVNSTFYNANQTINYCKGNTTYIGLDTSSVVLTEEAEIFWYKNDSLISEKSFEFSNAKDGRFKFKLRTGNCEYNSGQLDLRSDTKIESYTDSWLNERGQLTICDEGGEVRLKSVIKPNLFSSNISYTLKRDGEVVQVSENTFFDASEPGSYSTEINYDGCIIESEPLEVRVGREPSYNFEFSEYGAKKTLSFCEEISLKYNLRFYNPSSVSRVVDDNNKVYSSNTAVGTGNYYLKLTQGTCTIYDTLRVTLSEEFDMPLNKGIGDYCSPYLYLIGSTSFLSSQNFFLTKNGSLLSKGAGSYRGTSLGTYRLNYKSANSTCVGYTEEIAFDPLDLKEHFPIIGENDVTICSGEYYSLEIENLFYGSEITWYKDDKKIKVTGLSRISVNEPGRYWAEFTDNNGCQSQTESVNIRQENLPEVSILESCVSGSEGATLNAELSYQKDVSYQWYFEGSKIKEANNSSLRIYSPGVYSVSLISGVCNIKATEKEVGLTFPESITSCSKDTLNVIPIGDDSQVVKWILPNKDEVNNQNILSITGITKIYNGKYILESKSQAGCTYLSKGKVTVEDYVVFNIPSLLNVSSGDLIVPKPTFPRLSDTTEVPQNYYFRKKDTQSGYYYSVGLGEQELINSVRADSNTVGIYRMVATSNYGCSTEKEFEVKLVKKSAMRLAELGQGDLCPNSEVKIPIESTKQLAVGVNFIVWMYSGDGKDSLSAIVRNNIATINYIPPTFFKHYSSTSGIFFKLFVSDASIEPYRSKLYRFVGRNYYRNQIIKPLCDSVLYELQPGYLNENPSYQWYKNEELIVGAVHSIFSATENGEYNVIVTSSSNKECPTGDILTFHADDLLGRIDKPSIYYNQEASCDLGYGLFQIENSSSDVLYSWKRGELFLVEENKPYLSIKEDGKYSVQASLGSCVSVSLPLDYEPKQILSANLWVGNVNPDGYTSQGFFDYSKPLELCQGTSFNLRLGSGAYSNVRWYLNDELVDGSSWSNIFDNSGVYRATGTRGFCSVASRPIEIKYVETIKAQLRNLGADSVNFAMKGVLNLFSFAETGNGTIINTLGPDWYRNGQLYISEDEYRQNNDPNYFDSYIYPETEGDYYAVGEVVTHDGKKCRVESDTLKLAELAYGDIAINTVLDTSYISICGRSPYELEFSLFRAFNTVWYKNGVKIAENVESLFVSESALYEVVSKVKNVGLYKKIFNVEINAVPEITLNSGAVTTDIYEECNPSSNRLMLAKPFKGVTTYIWYRNDTLINNKDVSIKPLGNGIYKLKLVSEDCEVFSNDLELKFKNRPEVLLDESLQYICNGKPLTLKSLNDSTRSLIWMKGNQILSLTPANSFEIDSEGTFSAAIDDNSCFIESNVVSIEKLKIDNAIHYIDSVFCSGTSVMLTAEEQEGLNYRFLRNNETVYSGANTAYEVKESGLYSVFYEKSNCSIGSKEFLIRKDFETDILFESDTFCEGSSIDLSFETAEDLSYKWYKDNVPLSSGSSLLTVDEAGAYFAQLSSSNCSSFSDTIQVKNHEESTAKITGTSTIAYGDSSEIAIEISGDASPWQVTLSDGSELNINKSPYQLYVSPIQTTEYTISSLTDECGEGVFEGSAVVNLIILGTEVNELENIKIYPNPSDSYIFVDYSSEENPIPTLTSMDGKNVSFSYDFSNGKMRIDLSRIVGGTYLLSLENNGVKTVKKLIKR
ncbi:T9SS type A sorting domain-containing protein [Arcticibacterium luteifluviistationis]|uniref:Secretion system C-terminal sorting domain-containing protein n=1 Tax=Arcticibacterium luteifluviistationis TaxID=1784714 RepID=A0A2Z4GFJ3_9BACT|nr:T9SS type A sorting domain-containing protein [Arcticibacterium luteifluviistationis]AWV99553.1 hypothetical protein DJ013_15810 [Arcticibacterium luteifluviistationis]